MNMNPSPSIKELMDAGVHLGHSEQDWHPKMAPYLFARRQNMHWIDLEQTLPLLKQACQVVKKITSHGGKVLFLGTRPDMSNLIAIAARRCQQPYMNHRWVNGTFSNWSEIQTSIQQLKYLEHASLTAKQQRKYKRLKRSFQGLKEMQQLPDALFVIGVNQQQVAIKEATSFHIPVIGIADSNCDPRSITFPIPGNDDSLRAVYLYCRSISNAALEGLYGAQQKRTIV